MQCPSTVSMLKNIQTHQHLAPPASFKFVFDPSSSSSWENITAVVLGGGALTINFSSCLLVLNRHPEFLFRGFTKKIPPMAANCGRATCGNGWIHSQTATLTPPPPHTHTRSAPASQRAGCQLSGLIQVGKIHRSQKPEVLLLCR